jgi:type II secretory pathway component PulF
MFKNLYHTGEISGKLEESLNRLQTYYRDEGFLQMRLFTRLLNGVVYGIVAALVGYYVITFWVHYFSAAVNGV